MLMEMEMEASLEKKKKKRRIWSEQMELEMSPDVHANMIWCDSNCGWLFGSLAGCDNATAIQKIS